MKNEISKTALEKLDNKKDKVADIFIAGILLGIWILTMIILVIRALIR